MRYLKKCVYDIYLYNLILRNYDKTYKISKNSWI